MTKKLTAPKKKAAAPASVPRVKTKRVAIVEPKPKIAKRAAKLTAKSKQMSPLEIIEFNQKTHTANFPELIIAPTRVSPSPGGRPPRKTDDQWSIFLTELARSGNVTASAAVADIGRLAVYKRREVDPAFAIEWDKAQEVGFQCLEEEAMRRGVTGIRKPIYRNGVVVDYAIEYSDMLLSLLIRGRMRRIYGDKSEITVNTTGTATRGQLTDEELDELIKKKLGGVE